MLFWSCGNREVVTLLDVEKGLALDEATLTRRSEVAANTRMPHVQSAWLVACGERLGMPDVAGAAADPYVFF